MSVVVTDTSPVSYLVVIGEIDLLRRLYRRVVIPEIVLSELRAEDGIPVVREWARSLPEWVDIRSATTSLAVTKSKLHPGEREAITLAKELQATMLLVDDRIGADVALEQGLTITGTLGVLVEAAQMELINIESAILQLQATSFRASTALYQQAIDTAHGQPPVLPRRRKST